jgi:hypothetical protein
MLMAFTCFRKSSPKMRSRSRRRYRGAVSHGKGFTELWGGPLCGGVGRDAEVQDPAALVSQHEEYIQDLEADGRHGEEVHRDQVVT